MIVINTCGQTGRFGPTPEQCSNWRNDNETELITISESKQDEASAKLEHVKMKLRERGVQHWTAPSGGYYT